MERLSLLRGEDSQDDRLLETDIMRFLAIIGIVFWIIFALIKSIPFQIPEADSAVAQPVAKKETIPETPQPDVKFEATNHTRPVSVQQSKKADSIPSKTDVKDTKKVKIPSPDLPELQGVQMQFHSLEDLLDLMNTGRVRLFCRARAPGFDLLFEGNPKGKTVSFSSVNTLPLTLWEIKSGKDHAYFLDLIARTYPAIRSFPTRQVLVAFADEELDRSVGQTLDRLEQARENGIVSITRNGEIVYSPQALREKRKSFFSVPSVSGGAKKILKKTYESPSKVVNRNKGADR